MTGPLLATTFRFRVTLRAAGGPREAPAVLAAGGFAECTGLEAEMEVSEYPEGGRNDGVVQRVGRAKYPRLVLRRGMFHAPQGTVDPVLWRWLQDVVGGRRPVRRYSGTVELLATAAADTAPVATWAFLRALPARVVGPRLDARTGEVAIEEIQLVHEGLRLT